MNLFEVIRVNLRAIYRKFCRGEKIDKLPIFYINGSQTLPPPLSVTEESELLERIDDDDVKQVLVERNLRLVVYIAKKFENSGVDLEDLISIGTIGFMKAINTFKPNRNIKLATYGSRCIENEILMFLRRSNRLKSEVSIDEPLNQDGDGNELLLSDILGTEDDVVYKNLNDEVDRRLLRDAICKLSDKERNIMGLRFGIDGKKARTQKEVADMLGISQSYISRLEKKIMLKMRKDILSKTS